MRDFPKNLTLFVAIIALSSCATQRKYSHDAPLLPGMHTAKTPENDEKLEAPTPLPPPPEAPAGLTEADDDAVADLDTGSDDENDIDMEKAQKPPKRQIPFEFNQKVAEWIQYFSQKDRERFQRFLDRGEPYREVVQNILEENKVPADLYYLGLIESGFYSRAQSRVRAVGVWQFMRATGKMYGLRVDAFEDQRIDPIRATEAAAKMLRDLYGQFHSWYLAMAAYNAGPGRIRGVIRRAHTSDFWELVEKKKLPKETMEYVPKFLAARYISENPELFAFYINEEHKYPDVELVKVPSPVSFQSIENACAMPEGTLAFVNPQYLKPYTHPGLKEDEIWVPDAYVAKVRAQISNLAVHRVKIKASSKAVPLAMYKVKRGDTLKSIAGKQGLSVAYLKRVNGLKNGELRVGQRLSLAASSYHQKRVHPRTHKKRRSRK